MANVPCSLYAFGQKSADDVDSSAEEEKVRIDTAAVTRHSLHVCIYVCVCLRVMSLCLCA